MPPTPSRMMLTWTCSWGRRAISSASASSEPATSAFSTRLSSFSPRSARASTSSSETRRPAWRASASCFMRIARSLATRAAPRARSRRRGSARPASGTPSKPRISTGMPGVASSTRWPRKSCIARTRPRCSPATTASPTFMRPRWTSRVTTAPRPGSSRDSITKPDASVSGLALSSWISASVTSVSSRSSRFCLVLAETSTNSVSPPQSAGREALLRELAAHAVGVGAVLVDLVDRDHDRHAGGLGVVDRLDGLRHHAVVGGHDDHRDVGDLGAAGAHGREGLVAGGVEEGDRVVVVVDLVGADVLGDAAGLAGRHLGLADRVEQRGLAVVDVAHDRDHGRALDQLLVGVLVGGLGLGLLGRADRCRPSCRRTRPAPGSPRRRGSA